MSDNRSSARQAKNNLILQAHKERITRDIAYEAGATLEASDTSVSILSGDSKQVLCNVQSPKDLWPHAFAAICKMYPHLARYS